jgi:uncharacterized protein YbjT (DUF2867 family)
VSPRTALVLGATGLVGARCVVHLLESSVYDRVICLVRRPALSSLAAGSGGRLEQRVVDFDALTRADVDAAEDVFCAIGTTMKKAGSKAEFRRVDYDIPLRTAKLAVEAGAKRLALVSSAGSNARSSVFYQRTKGELEEALASLPLRAFHIFKPSLLEGERAESRPAEAVAGAAMSLVGGLLMGPLRKWRPIDVDQVGRAMVAAMVGPDPDPPSRVHHYDDIVRLAQTLTPRG